MRLLDDNEAEFDFEVIPNAWIISDTTCWFPKSSKARSTLADVVQECLPPSKKNSFIQRRMELYFGHGKLLSASFHQLVLSYLTA